MRLSMLTRFDPVSHFANSPDFFTDWGWQAGWVYVALRVVHSLIQSTFNKIEVRFSVFVLSSFVLIALTVNAARLAF